jgi:shikimate kinase
MDSDITLIHSKLKKPVVMVGLMGAGKTKIGGIMAKALGLPFIDADVEIERAAGMSVAEIFETEGEPAFRDLERRVIARLLSDEIKIVAPGGGAMMNDQTADLIRTSAISIWLRADLDVLVERTGRNTKRPLLRNGNPRDILQGLMDKRHPVYRTADITVDSGPTDVEENARKTLQALAAYLEKTDIAA